MKRLLTGFFVLFSISTQAGLPPTTLSGDQATVKPITFTTILPNKQATQISGTNSRIETGNQNLLQNPSFEGANGSGWSITNGSTSIDSTNQVEGKQAMSVTLSGIVSIIQNSTINVVNTVGQQAMASIYVKTALTDVSVCALNAGVETNCVVISGTNAWVQVQIPFILSATSNGIKVKTTSSTTGTILVDNAFVGLSSPFQNVNGAQLIDVVTVTGCAAAWATTSTTFAALGTQTGCTYTSAKGICTGPNGTNTSQTADASIKCSTLNAGDYSLEYEGGYKGTVATSDFSFQFSDGTNTAREVSYLPGAGTTIPASNSIKQSISYSAQQSNITLTIKGKVQSGNTLNLYGISTIPGSFKIYYYPPQSKIYSAASQDYDWTSYTPTVNGMTISGSNCYHKRKGSDLYLRCTFTVASTSAAEARVLFPNSLVTSSLLPTLSQVGTYANNQGAASYQVLLTEPSVGYVTFGVSQSTSNPLTKVNGTNFALSTLTLVSGPIPIQGWQDYGVIVGSFAGLEKCASDYECTDTFSAKISNTGVVSDSNLPWIASTSYSAGLTTINLNSNLKNGTSGLSGVLNCSASSANQNVQATVDNTISTISTIKVNTFVTNSLVLGQYPFNLICTKSGQDYRPTTAKIASSVGVPVVGGLTNQAVDIGTISFGATQTSNCTTVSSNCAYLDQIGTMFNPASGVAHGASAGTYSLNFNATYSKVKCTSQFNYAGSQLNGSMSCASCNTLSFNSLVYNAGTGADTFGNIICIGTR